MHEDNEPPDPILDGDEDENDYTDDILSSEDDGWYGSVEGDYGDPDWDSREFDDD